MKYCVNYKRSFKYLNEIDEIKIIYNPNDKTLEDFLLLHNSQRVNIVIPDEEDFIKNDRIKIFKYLATEHPELDFALVIDDLKINKKSKEVYEIITQCGAPIKYFFAAMVRDWDTLWGYIKYNPSDMYITDALGFEINKVSEVLHSRNIKIRVFANVAQSVWREIEPLRKFFIRPEDVKIYEMYVDVIEFFDSDNSSETLYKIYTKDKKWFGPLRELILDFDCDIDNRFIISTFGMFRTRCGKRCQKGSKCRICDVTQQLSETLKDRNILAASLDK